jgi:hypothetical protein
MPLCAPSRSAPIVALDHPHRGTHHPRKLEHRHPRGERVRGERVSHVVRRRGRLDPRRPRRRVTTRGGRKLSRLSGPPCGAGKTSGVSSRGGSVSSAAVGRPSDTVLTDLPSRLTVRRSRCQSETLAGRRVGRRRDSRASRAPRRPRRPSTPCRGAAAPSVRVEPGQSRAGVPAARGCPPGADSRSRPKLEPLKRKSARRRERSSCTSPSRHPA